MSSLQTAVEQSQPTFEDPEEVLRYAEKGWIIAQSLEYKSFSMRIAPWVPVGNPPTAEQLAEQSRIQEEHIKAYWEKKYMDWSGQARVINGCIQIIVPIKALPEILDGACRINNWTSHNEETYEVKSLYKVSDAEVFAKEICQEINSEDEEGTTIFHKMFDRSMLEAIEQGALGVEEV